MRKYTIGRPFGARGLAAVALGLVAVFAACSTKHTTIPPLSGPSELGLSLSPTAYPDVLVADGASTAAVQVTVRDQNGQPKAGQRVYFATADGTGTFADIGFLSSSTAVSGPDGTAQVVYTAPVRTDFTANGVVMIAVRPVGGDANGEVYRFITIELRSAEGRLFPENPTNKLPLCPFTIEAPFGYLVDQSILFQTNASDTDGFIVRYFWTFGDSSTPSDKPDVEHHYKEHGHYDVTQTVTDNNGGQATCTQTIHVCDTGDAPCPQP